MYLLCDREIWTHYIDIRYALYLEGSENNQTRNQNKQEQTDRQTNKQTYTNLPTCNTLAYQLRTWLRNQLQCKYQQAKKGNSLRYIKFSLPKINCATEWYDGIYRN